MNAKVPYNIVDRNDLIKYITEEIEKSPNKEFELSVTDLGKKYDVQGPTMDYHIKKLLEENVFVVADKKGKYSRKILVLPGSEQAQPKAPVINNMSSFKDLIQQKIDSGELKINNNDIDDEIEEITPVDSTTQDKPSVGEILKSNVSLVKTDSSKDTYDEPLLPEEVEKVEVEEIENMYDEPLLPEESKNEVQILDKGHHTVDRYEAPGLTLDNKIRRFLEESNKIPTANQLISRQDKEVISVMTESIQQHMVYLKDLMDTLKLVETLNMVRELIDERNKMLEEMQQMREEHRSLISSIQNDANQVSVDPQRVRLMHQIIINTVDTYLDQPNHSLALNRVDFRNSITKEVGDLANYILGIEK